MPIDAKVPQCQHVRMDGTRCGSPAMRGTPLCYFHTRPAKIEDLKVHDIADPREQLKVLNEVANALLAGKIDHKRATTLIWTVQLAQSGSYRRLSTPPLDISALMSSLIPPRPRTEARSGATPPPDPTPARISAAGAPPASTPLRNSNANAAPMPPPAPTPVGLETRNSQLETQS